MLVSGLAGLNHEEGGVGWPIQVSTHHELIEYCAPRAVLPPVKLRNIAVQQQVATPYLKILRASNVTRSGVVPLLAATCRREGFR